VNITSEEIENKFSLFEDGSKGLRGKWQQGGENGVRREIRTKISKINFCLPSVIIANMIQSSSKNLK